MTRIDAHHHFWKIARGDYAWLTEKDFPILYRDYLPHDVIRYLKQCDIEKTVLVQGAETAEETEFLLAIAHDTPFVAGVVGWMDLAARDATEQIARLAQNEKLVSLRPMLQTLSDDAWILRPELAAGLKALRSSNLKFDILIFPRHLPHITTFLARYPDQPFVIDHGAKPYIAKGEIEPWRTKMSAIAHDFPNVCCKLSGLATEAAPGWTIDDLRPYVAALIDMWGPKRLMWGSDWPVLNVAGNYLDWFAIAQKLTAHLSEAERAEIFGGTAARFYSI